MILRFREKLATNRLIRAVVVGENRSALDKFRGDCTPLHRPSSVRSSARFVAEAAAQSAFHSSTVTHSKRNTVQIVREEIKQIIPPPPSLIPCRYRKNGIKLSVRRRVCENPLCAKGFVGHRQSSQPPRKTDSTE